MNALDQELIEKLLSSSMSVRTKSWEHIYKSYYPIIKDMIMKNNGTKDDARDIFQDGLNILHRNLSNGSFRNMSTLNTYIFGICKNLWLREYDRKQKEADLQPELIIEARLNHHYLVDVEIVTLLMTELEDDCRKILTEYYFNNRSMAELKDMFNVNSIQAVKNKKWRCFNYLKKLFKEKGVTPTWS